MNQPAATQQVLESQLTIRPMRWWDIPSVDTIEGELFPHDRWSTDQWWRELAALHNHYWVATVNAEIIGYCGLSVQTPDADVQTMAIGTTWQGRGHGKVVLDHLIESSKSFGVRFIFLEVREDNAPAIALYGHAGFTRMSSRPAYYPDGSTALIYRRDDREANSTE